MNDENEREEPAPDPEPASPPDPDRIDLSRVEEGRAIDVRPTIELSPEELPPMGGLTPIQGEPGASDDPTGSEPEAPTDGSADNLE